jgi:hypothetical protein
MAMVRLPAEATFSIPYSVQTGSEDHPASDSVRTGVFSKWVKATGT